MLEHGGFLEFASDAGVRDLGLGEPREIDRLAEERRTPDRRASCR
jgi:hypothetical protein